MSEYIYTGAASADQAYLLKGVAASGIADSTGACDIQGNDLKVLFDASLSADEKTALDWIVTNAQTLPLGEEMVRKIGAMGVEITTFIEARYPQPIQSSLNFFMEEAHDKTYTNRAIEIQKGIDWLTTCLNEYYAKKADVLTKTTASGIQAVTLDLATCASADPLLDLETVKNIVD